VKQGGGAGCEYDVVMAVAERNMNKEKSLLEDTKPSE
jgi:hypothetical protein